ncbi:MAG: carbon-nitrogen hydrolase family protein [Bacillota bacterium]
MSEGNEQMRVAALSLHGIRMDSSKNYRSDLTDLLQKSNAAAAVIPAFSSLALGLGTGRISAGASFAETVRAAADSGSDWQEEFLALHSELARDNGLFLTAGTVYERENDRIYHTLCCFDPAGNLCCRQRQIHLTRFEREQGLSRGEELILFDLHGLQAGLVVGIDARHPEVGRGFALLGADILLHSGALKGELNCWPQAAGMWAQVQQNQFWAVEALFCGRIGRTDFAADSAVIGPCEITPGQSGYLARGYPHTPFICANLEMEDLYRIRRDYPLLKMLNPQAYREDLFV